MRHKILVTGSRGQLGTCFLNYAYNSTEGYDWHFTDVMEDDFVHNLNITDYEQVYNYVKSYEIDIIINCAAYTNAEKAEDDVETATLINETGCECLAKVAKEFDATLIHISTDYVFDGEKNIPYTPDDETYPLSIYGLTKRNGENAIIESGCKHLIFRTAWLYSEYGKNFCKTMINLFEEKDELKVVDDQVGTPTNAYDLMKCIMTIINTDQINKCGVYHYSNLGVASWYDFAYAINRFSHSSNCKVLPCTSNEFKQKAVRPTYSVLDKTKTIETFGVEIPHWLCSLENCISKIMTIN